MMEEIEILIRSKRTIIYLVTNEENRVMSALENVCSKADVSWDLLQWDIVNGLDSKDPEFLPANKQMRQLDQEEILNWYQELIQAQKLVFHLVTLLYVQLFPFFISLVIFIRHFFKYFLPFGFSFRKLLFFAFVNLFWIYFPILPTTK